MDNNLITWFIAATMAAVVLQFVILLALFITIRKLAGRMEALADRVEDTTGVLQVRVLPILDNVKTIGQQVSQFVETSRPKIDTLVDNVSQVSTTARTSVDRLNVTLNDAIDRMRLQVIRGDEMVTRTMDRIEETGEKVQHSVMSPVRQVSGLMQAISTGLGAYFHQQRRRRNGGPSDEMFI